MGKKIWRIIMKSSIRNEIKAQIIRAGYTMQEVVDLLHDEYGWSDSVSNLSGKLQRGSLRYREAVELAEYIRDMGYNPEQVQDFYPTPSTLSTVMYCTGLDPRTMERVYVPTDPHEKAMQRALIQYRDPKNYALVREALVKAHREDLIGSGAKCLIRSAPPRPVRKKPVQSNGKRKPSK